MALQGNSQVAICNTLGYTISQHSPTPSLALYEENQAVVCDPNEYEECGRPNLLSAEDSFFMVELVRNQPCLFLNKICERTYNQQNTLICKREIHHNLMNLLSITLKKANTVNINKCLIVKYSWVEKMKDFPT